MCCYLCAVLYHGTLFFFSSARSEPRQHRINPMDNPFFFSGQKYNKTTTSIYSFCWFHIQNGCFSPFYVWLHRSHAAGRTFYASFIVDSRYFAFLFWSCFIRCFSIAVCRQVSLPVWFCDAFNNETTNAKFQWKITTRKAQRQTNKTGTDRARTNDRTVKRRRDCNQIDNKTKNKI